MATSLTSVRVLKNYYLYGFEYIPSLVSGSDCFVVSSIPTSSSVTYRNITTFCVNTPADVTLPFDVATFKIFGNVFNGFFYLLINQFNPRQLRLRPNSQLLYIADYSGFYRVNVFCNAVSVNVVNMFSLHGYLSFVY